MGGLCRHDNPSREDNEIRVYAERPAVAIRQASTDLLVIAGVYILFRAAFWLHGLLERLAEPGVKLEQAGTALADRLGTASRQLGAVPLLGDDPGATLDKASGSARALAGFGRQQQQWAHELALTVPGVLLLLPLVLVLFGWLPLRLRGMRNRARMAALRETGKGRDLLALKALVSQPLTKLSTIDGDVADACRRGDSATINALMALQLRTSGLQVRLADTAQ